MCLTLCDPIDGSPPGSPIPGILQARTLEGVAISFSNTWKWKVKAKPLSCVRLAETPWTAAYQAPPSMGFFQARVLEWVAIAFSPYCYKWQYFIFYSWVLFHWDFPSGSGVKEFAVIRRHGFDPELGKIPWRREWQPTPVFLPRKFHGQRSLVGCSQSMRSQDLDMT